MGSCRYRGISRSLTCRCLIHMFIVWGHSIFHTMIKANSITSNTKLIKSLIVTIFANTAYDYITKYYSVKVLFISFCFRVYNLIFYQRVMECKGVITNNSAAANRLACIWGLQESELPTNNSSELNSMSL